MRSACLSWLAIFNCYINSSEPINSLEAHVVIKKVWVAQFFNRFSTVIKKRTKNTAHDLCITWNLISTRLLQILILVAIFIMT